MDERKLNLGCLVKNMHCKLRDLKIWSSGPFFGPATSKYFENMQQNQLIVLQVR